MPPSRIAARLRRLLTIVPYVVRRPGTAIEELTRLFGVTEEEVTEDLNLLLLTGLPPYSPGDLIEVDIDEGRVWIRMADHFSRPVRLTRAEAVSLYLTGTALLGAGAPEAEPLRSALRKLEDALGPEALGELRAEVGEPSATPATLDAVRRATADRERIEIEHYSAHRDEVITRRIDPEQVFSAIGNWYVAAWDHRSDEERLFRIDRIRKVRSTGERFDPRGLAGPGRELYTRTEEDTPVRLRLHPQARWVAEYYEVEKASKRGSVLEVTIPTKDLAWVAKLVLRLGGAAEIVSPPGLRALAGRMAEETLSLYRRRSRAGAGPGARR